MQPNSIETGDEDVMGSYGGTYELFEVKKKPSGFQLSSACIRELVRSIDSLSILMIINRL